MKVPCGYKFYLFEGAVQFLGRNPVICGDSIMWLEPIKCLGKSYVLANQRALLKYKKMYPQYRDFIGFY